MAQTPPKNSNKPVMGKIENIIMSQLDKGISPENISAKDEYLSLIIENVVAHRNSNTQNQNPVKIQHSLSEKVKKAQEFRDTKNAIQATLDGSRQQNIQIPTPHQPNNNMSYGNGVTQEGKIANIVANPKLFGEIIAYTDQYLSAANSDLKNRETNPTMPGVTATPEIIDRTLAFMVHLGGEKKRLSGLEKEAIALSTALQDGSAAKSSKFQQDYANFCASAHENVAAYHGAQQKYFLELAANDKNPGGADYWKQCAQTAGKLKDISIKDAENNRTIGQIWGKQQELSQAKPVVEDLPQEVVIDSAFMKVQSSLQKQQSITHKSLPHVTRNPSRSITYHPLGSSS
jgi:hypothetical protein